MKKKLPIFVKDGIAGFAIGVAVLIPGVSGGTIALILGAFKKMVNAVDHLFSKDFWKSFLTLLPFLIGAVVAVGVLIVPFNFFFEYCMLAIVCLFVGFILGSLPGVIDNVKGHKPTKTNIALYIVGFLAASSIGVLSVIFDLSTSISALFEECPPYLYSLIFGVGILTSSGLIVPGFSGSMLCLVIGYYKPIIALAKSLFETPAKSFSLLFTYAVGVAIGFVMFSKLMNYCFTKHKISSYSVVLGFLAGSIISILINSDMVNYLKESSTRFGGGIIDWILSPILLVVGVIISYKFIQYVRKHPEVSDNA